MRWRAIVSSRLTEDAVAAGVVHGTGLLLDVKLPLHIQKCCLVHVDWDCGGSSTFAVIA